MNISIKSGNVTINGRTYSGRSFSINDGRVVVDGKPQDGERLVGPISVHVNGDCDSVECESGDVTVMGLVRGSAKTVSGDIRCADVGGSVQTVSGDVSCGNVAGSVGTVSGDIKRGR